MPEPVETKEHAEWREKIELKTLWQQRYEQAFTHLALNATDLTISACSDRAADYATAVEDNSALYRRELAQIGPEPAFSEPAPEAPPAPVSLPSPLMAHPNPGMNYAGWNQHERRPY